MLGKILSTCAAAGLCLLATTASAYEPFLCTGSEVYIVQDKNATLYTLDMEADPPDALTPVRDDRLPYGFEINNLGFNRRDGLLYAYRITPPVMLLKIDANGDIVETMQPQDMPVGILNAGDVSLDGTKMYLNTSGWHPICTVDLPPMVMESEMPILFDHGLVRDWAVNPMDGLLYGGDDEHGEIARLDPVTGIREVCDTQCPPTTTYGYGAAWFDAAGHLFVYDNYGTICEITDPDGGPIQCGGSHLEDCTPGYSVSAYNDGASCVQDILGAAKQMTVTAGGPPATVTIDFVFENISGSRVPTAAFDLYALSVVDDLTAVFGTYGVDWTFVGGSVSSQPAGFANPAFDGHSVTELVNQNPPQNLFVGETATVSLAIEVLTPGEFCNQVLVIGDTVGGGLIGDHSTAGLDPDPNGDGSPIERAATCVTIVGPCTTCGPDGDGGGRITTLTLEYLGAAAAWIEVEGKFGKDREPLFEGTVESNGSFVVLGTYTGRFDGTLGNDIFLSVDGVYNATIHTSCSQEIGPGQIAGDFMVLAGANSFGPLCPL